MCGFCEQNFDVTNCSFVISSIAFSKCTQVYNNCVIELSLIITKSRAKLKVIFKGKLLNIPSFEYAYLYHAAMRSLGNSLITLNTK